MKKIELTQGKYALVDDEDFEWLNSLSWRVFKVDNLFYAQYSVNFKENGKIKIRGFSMHRIIMEASKGQIIDHKDGDGLNNQKSNLRFATSSENVRNKKGSSKSQSGFKGVFKCSKTEQWRARINIGSFKTKEEAAKAYDEAANYLYGIFAKTNGT